MNLDINFEPDAEQITLVYDNSIQVVATRQIDGTITYSKNFEKLEDDDMCDTVEAICKLLFQKCDA